MEEYSATQQAVIDTHQNITQDKTSSLKLFFTQGKIRNIHKQENNGVSIIFILFCQILFILHVGITQQLLSAEILRQYLAQIINSLYSETAIYIILQTITILLKLVMVQSVYMVMFSESIIIGLTWLNKKIFQSLYIIKQLDFALTAYLLLVNWQQNLVYFLLSVVFDIVYVRYMQNYIFRKDIFYVSSVKQNTIFRSLLVIGYLSNIFFLNFGSQLGFCVYQAAYSFAVCAWYVLWGNNLYIHNVMAKEFLIMTAVQGTIGVCLMQVAVSGSQFLRVQNIAQVILIFTVLAGLLLVLKDKRSMTNIQLQQEDQLKDYELQIQQLLQLSNSEIEAESNLYGIFSYHLLTCRNRKCPCYNDEIFEPVLRVMTKPKQIANQKDSCYRFYFVCQYENEMAKHPADYKLLLDYCEFLFNEVGNIYVLMLYLQRAENMNLSLIERIKISKLRAIVREQNQRFNSQLYRGKVQLENVIQSEECFQSIQRNITNYIQQNLSLWNDFFSPEINLSIFSGKLSSTFILIESMSQAWKKIYKYLGFHRHWRFIYLNFLLFIKNERTKLREADESIISDANSPIISHHKILFDQSNFGSQQIMTESILFDKDSFCIKAYLQSNELIIKQVSKYCQKNTLYKCNQIIGLPLNKMIPAVHRQPHDKAILKWIQDGYLVDQNSYQIRFTSYIDKLGRQIPAFKYYKCHCHIENGLQFICLLKSNIKQHINNEQLIQTPVKINSIPRLIDDRSFAQGQTEGQSIPIVQSSRFSSQSNIFIKDDTLKCESEYRILSKYKLIGRSFCVLILVTIVILSVINRSNTNNLIQYCSQYYNFMNMYRYPLFLGILYLKNILNVGSQTINLNSIKSLTSNMQIYSTQSSTLEGLFDTSLFVPATYTPYYNYSDIPTYSYNQIDLFYLIMSSMASLNTFPINRTDQSFKLFNSYITPSYDHMMNISKNNLHAKFGTIFASNEWNFVSFIITQAVLFVFFLMLAFYYLHRASKKYKNIFQILLDFHYNDVQRIISYWQNKQMFFGKAFLRMHPYSKQATSSSLPKQSAADHRSTKMLRTIKSKLVEGKELRRRQFCMKFQVVMSTLLILLSAVSIQIISIGDIKKLVTFQNDGFLLLKYFPCLAIVGYGSMEKYYSLKYPSEVNFNPDRYAESISTSFLLGNLDYIGSMVDSSSLFYQKQKNYVFGNPCTYNPQLLIDNGLSVASCGAVGNGSLSRGITSFVRYSQRIMQQYVKGQTNLTANDLDSLTLGIRILSTFVFDALQTWNQQLAQNVENMSYQQTVMAIVMGVLIFLIHVLINEFVIMRRISQDYDFILPEYILIKEKVIKQKFVIEELIVQ